MRKKEDSKPIIDPMFFDIEKLSREEIAEMIYEKYFANDGKTIEEDG